MTFVKNWYFLLGLTQTAIPLPDIKNMLDMDFSNAEIEIDKVKYILYWMGLWGMEFLVNEIFIVYPCLTIKSYCVQ